MIFSNSNSILLAIFIAFNLMSCQRQDTSEQQVTQEIGIESNETMNAPAESTESPKLRHVVLFKFKDDADPAAIKKAEDAFAALPAKIPEIRDFEWGLNNSPEGLNKGLTHCYLLTFNSEEDRAIYLPHPDHQAFGALLKDILEDVTVVDYWTD